LLKANAVQDMYDDMRIAGDALDEEEMKASGKQ
jgi:hypothetical protein